MSLLYSCTTDKGLDKLAPAYQREQEVLDGMRTKLEAHQGYWRMAYYPDEHRSYGGYNIYVRFVKGRVEAITELDMNKDSSSYDLVSIDMPTLTFDTRNEVLHHFSTATEYFRNARGGDFELLIRGNQADTILLEGRKTHNQIRLEPINVEPSQEIASIQKVHQTLQGKGIQPMTIGSLSGVQIALYSTYRTMEFILPATGEDGKATSIKEAFHYTTNGIRFYEPVSIGGVRISALKLSKDASSLLDESNGLVFKLTTPILDFYRNKYVVKLAEGSASLQFYGSLRSVNKEMVRQYGEQLSTTMYLGSNTASDVEASLEGNDTSLATMLWHDLNDTKGKSVGRSLSYEMDFAAHGDNAQEINFFAIDGNESTFWYYYDRSVKPWINLFRRYSPYKVEKSTSDGVDTYRLTSTKDSRYWFDIKAL
jgi:hypothetical protein